MGIANGKDCTLHSLTLKPDAVDDFQEQWRRARPGDEIDVEAPLSVNLEFKDDSGSGIVCREQLTPQAGKVVIPLRCDTTWHDSFRLNKKRTIPYRHFGLQLTFASTFHKLQGVTLSKLILDISEERSLACLYVALSRPRSAAGLRLFRALDREDMSELGKLSYPPPFVEWWEKIGLRRPTQGPASAERLCIGSARHGRLYDEGHLLSAEILRRPPVSDHAPVFAFLTRLWLPEGLRGPQMEREPSRPPRFMGLRALERHWSPEGVRAVTAEVQKEDGKGEERTDGWVGWVGIDMARLLRANTIRLCLREEDKQVVLPTEVGQVDAGGVAGTTHEIPAEAQKEMGEEERRAGLAPTESSAQGDSKG
jgi:hypothetical protein